MNQPDDGRSGLGPSTRVSVVVPVHDNVGTLPELARRTLGALAPVSGVLDVWFIDDRSDDESWMVIRRLAGQDRRICGLRLAANVGNLTARAAGCAEAQGDVICTLDADLENAPEDLPRLLEHILAGSDLVSAVRVDQRGRPIARRMATGVTRRAVARRWDFAPRDFGCGLKAWRAELGRAANGHLETDRDVAWALRLFDQVRSYAEIDVVWTDRRRRSSYGWRRKIRQGADLARG